MHDQPPLGKFGMLPQPLWGDYWSHLRSWWPHRHDGDTLALCFEDMKQDLPGTVRKVAGFMNIDDEEAIDVATRQASFEFMKEHAARFDEHPLQIMLEKTFDLPHADAVGKVRTGRIGDSHSELSDQTRAALDQRWQKDIYETLGIASYHELRARLAA